MFGMGKAAIDWQNEMHQAYNYFKEELIQVIHIIYNFHDQAFNCQKKNQKLSIFSTIKLSKLNHFFLNTQ